MKISLKVPTVEEIKAAEVKLGFTFPADYISLMQSGGLGDLRIKNRLLSPAEVVSSRRYLRGAGLVPFADNGCGDLYCWDSQSRVVFADHETGAYIQDSESFSAWLDKNRF